MLYIFCNEIRDDLMKKHPELNFSEINKKLGKKWNELENKQNCIRSTKKLEIGNKM